MERALFDLQIMGFWGLKTKRFGAMGLRKNGDQGRFPFLGASTLLIINGG
jgi:hypothetical protein